MPITNTSTIQDAIMDPTRSTIIGAQLKRRWKQRIFRNSERDRLDIICRDPTMSRDVEST